MYFWTEVPAEDAPRSVQNHCHERFLQTQRGILPKNVRVNFAGARFGGDVLEPFPAGKNRKKSTHKSRHQCAAKGGGKEDRAFFLFRSLFENTKNILSPLSLLPPHFAAK